MLAAHIFHAPIRLLMSMSKCIAILNGVAIWFYVLPPPWGMMARLWRGAAHRSSQGFLRARGEERKRGRGRR